MSLIGNYSVLNKSCGRWLAGNSTAHASGVGTNTATCSARLKWADWRNFSMQDRAAGTGSIQNLAAKPNGYYPPGAWALPSKAGNVSRYGGLISISISGSGALGRNIDGSTTISLTASGTGQLVVSGMGSFTMNVTGSGSIVATRAAVGSFTASLSASGALLGKGNITGTTTLTLTAAATRYATGELAGDFSANYEFSPDNLARAVWDALAAEYGVNGSFGEYVSAIKAKTDSLTFTVAGKVDSNIKYVNNTLVTGSGTAGSPWGP